MRPCWADINGELLPAATATVSAFDLGFSRGDSILETILVLRWRPCLWRAHFRRLLNASDATGIPIPPEEVLVSRVERVIHRVQRELGSLQRAALRIQVSSGVSIDFAPATEAIESTVVVAIGTLEPQRPIAERGRRAIISGLRRSHAFGTAPAQKTGSYLNSVLAAREARRLGYDESIMLGDDGLVAEAASANLFALLEGVWQTPRVDVGILPGITRAHLLELCSARGIDVVEADLSVEDLRRAEEVVLTSSLRGLTPIVEIEGSRVGDGRVGAAVRRLNAHYEESLSASALQAACGG